MVVQGQQGDSSEENKDCVFCMRVCRSLIYSLTNVSRGLQCYLISQVPIFLKLVVASLNHAIKSVYNTRIRRNHVPLLNEIMMMQFAVKVS